MRNDEQRPKLAMSVVGQSMINDGVYFKLLGVLVAIAWPVFTVLPDDRFGGMFMPNAILYGFLFLISVISFLRKAPSALHVFVLFISVCIFIPAILQSQNSSISGGFEKSLDVLITHFIFILAGIAAGRNFCVFIKYFIVTLLAICAFNLAIELYPNFSIQDRSSIGVLGGQGFARMLVLGAVGMVMISPSHGSVFSKLGLIVFVLAIIFLCLIVGARSSLLGFAAAMIVYWLNKNRRLIPYLSLFIITSTALLAWFISEYYLETLRPLFIDSGLTTGISRTLLTFDIFFLETVGEDKVLSVLERSHLWRDAIRIVIENPLQGTGLGGYESYASIGNEKAPHNIPLEVLVEMGVVAGAIYLIILLSLVLLAPAPIMPYLIVLIVLFSLSGDLVDLRQLLFFLGMALQVRLLRAKGVAGLKYRRVKDKVPIQL